MEREFFELQRDTAKRLDFEHVVMDEDNDTSNVPGPQSGTLMDISDASSVDELREIGQTIRGRLKSVQDILIEKFQADVEQQEAALVLAMELKDYLCSKQSKYIESSVEEGTLQWLKNWKIGNEDVDISLVTDDSERDNKREELESTKSAESVLQIESLIKAVVQEVNELKMSIANEYDSLEDVDRELDRLEADEGMATYLNNDGRGSSSVLSKPTGSLRELESSIALMEEELKRNEKEFLEAEATSESRIKDYEREIAELQAQMAQLGSEEESLTRLDSIIAEYLRSQRHMECSNGVSVVSFEEGYVELRMRTYLPRSQKQAESAGQSSNSVSEHSLRVKFNQETRDIEEAQLTPDDVPIKDLLQGVQENSVQDELFGPRKKLAKLGSKLALLVDTIHEWQSFQTSKATMSGSQ